jgi:3-isopropylmalate/(R)-2-methylmalate dehydratase small subunit
VTTSTSGLIVEGRCAAVGDDLDTDRMYPGRYLGLTDWREQARHILEGLGSDWPARLAGNAVLLAGRNLGIGSAREPAATGLLGAGVRLVIAKSCARPFFRNCINNGLPVIQDEAVAGALSDGDTITVDLSAGRLSIAGRTLEFAPMPPLLNDIVAAGGLLNTLSGPPRTSA